MRHYDRRYFDWQKKVGEFGGKANLFKFANTVKGDDCVIDFGCGGGYLLKNLCCRKKIGIELNKSAHQEIKENGVVPFVSSEELISKMGHGFADVVVSNHALEHTQNPFFELQSLFSLLKDGGLIHFVVPCESVYNKWSSDDINMHLFSWSPMNLGNLFSTVGFEVLNTKPIMHKWPPYYGWVQKLFGWRLFHLVCRIYGRVDRRWFQIEIIAKKPVPNV